MSVFPIPALRALMCASALLCCASAGAQVQSTESSDQNVPAATARKQAAEIAAGDPARWSREDTTSAARLKTLQKEIGAALQESLGNCRRGPSAERTACAKQARATYKQELAGAKAQAMAGQ